MATIIVVILASGVLSTGTVNYSNDLSGENNLNGIPTPHTESVVSGSIAVNAKGFYFVAFQVPEGALNPVLQGSFTSTGNSTNNAVIVTVMGQKDFVNYLSGHNCHIIYNKDLVPMETDNINVTLQSGIYVITFTSASTQAKTVSAQIDLTYSK